MKKETQHFLYAGLGLLFGIAAKYLDAFNFAGILFSEMGVWIFITCLIAYFSKNAKNTAINTLLFFVFMLLGYYLYTIFILKFIPDTSTVLTWTLIALLSPLWGAILSFARDAGFLGALCSALPAALLLHLGYPFFYTHKLLHALYLLFAVIVFLLFNKSIRQKWQSALAVFVLFLAFKYLDVFSILFGGI